MAGSPKPETAVKRARVGGLRRHFAPDHPRVLAARRELDFTKLADHIAAVIAGWGPPTDEQLDRIAALLRAGTRSGDGQ